MRKTGFKWFVLCLVLLMGMAFAVGCEPEEEEVEPEEDVDEEVDEEEAIDYPENDVRIIVYQAAGGGADTETRALQPYLQEALGVPVVVENVTGAGGRIGAAEAFGAEPDGYTLLVEMNPMTTIGQIVYDGDYNMEEFVYLKNWLQDNYVICTAKDSGIETMDDLIAEIEEGGVLHGSPGVGSAIHFQSEIMKDDLGLDYEEVPYDGTAPAITALLGGDVDFVITTSARAIAGQDEMNLLASIGPERLPTLPDTPTIIEEGYEPRTFTLRRGFLAPPGLPDEIKEVLIEALGEALEAEGYQQWIEDNGIPFEILGPDEYRQESLEYMELVEENKHLFEE